MLMAVMQLPWYVLGILSSHEYHWTKGCILWHRILFDIGPIGFQFHVLHQYHMVASEMQYTWIDLFLVGSGTKVQSAHRGCEKGLLLDSIVRDRSTSSPQVWAIHEMNSSDQCHIDIERVLLSAD